MIMKSIVIFSENDRIRLSEIMRRSVAQWLLKVFDSGAKDPRFNFRSSQKIVSITARSITASDHGAGVVDDKDFAVTSDQGNA